MIGAPVTCPVFIGRQAELDALAVARRALAQSRGSAVLLGGEAGIGKSRLLAQFLRNAGDGRARTVASSECLERAQQPFGPIRALVTAIYPTLEASALPVNALRALAQIAPDGMVDLPVSYRVAAPLEKPDLFAALASFLRFACSRRSLILTIEDVHWADRSTLEFLEYLVPRIANARLLIVATYRSDEIEASTDLMGSMARIGRAANVHIVELESLSETEVRALLTGALAGLPVLPAQTTRDIARRCEGNPFFAEELLKSALDQRRAERSAELPRTIRSSILRRVVELSDRERRVLSYAAALGYRFEPHLLATVMAQDLDVVIAALHRARSLNIIVDERGPAGTCRFRHALTRQTIYDDLLAFDAQRMHAQILSSLEQLPDRDRYVEALAYNAAAANDCAKTIAYSESAGDAALALKAAFEAGEHYERAIGSSSDEAQRAVLFEKLGDAQLRLMAGERALAAFEAAKGIRLERGEIAAAARVVAKTHTAITGVGRPEAAIEFVEIFLRDWGSQIEPSLQAEFRCMQAMSAASFGDAERMGRLLHRVPDAQMTSDDRSVIQYGICEAMMTAIEGDRDGWLAATARVEPLMRIEDADFAVHATRLAIAGISVAANAEVERLLASATASAHEHGLLSMAGFAASLRSLNAYLTGRLPEARDALLDAMSNDAIFAAKYHVIVTGPLIGSATGDAELVRTTLAPEMVERFRATGFDGPFVVTASAQAIAALFEGRDDHARALLRDVVERLRVPYFSMFALPLCARYVDLQHLERLRQFCADPVRALRPVFGASGALVEAIAARRQGDAAHARRYAADAARRFAELGWPLFEAQAHEEMGDDSGAHDIYLRCGATADAARLSPTSPQRAPERIAGALSSREREVAEHVSRGLTNVAIAERLSVSPKTVEKHLSSIFGKLSVGSRAEIAAFISREATADETRVTAR